MERTTFGKRVYAVGSNRTVAILSGIRAGRPKTQYLMIVGFTASLVGVVSVSRLGVIIIALTRNFLNLARIEVFWQGFATGAMILGAVLLEALQRRISDRR